MIRERAADKMYNSSLKSKYLDSNIEFDTQQLVLNNDTLKIETASPKLVIPKSFGTEKLKQITEKIRNVDPAKEFVSKPVIKAPIIEIDTVDYALYNPDTIPFIVTSNKSDNLFVDNYFYNIPDYKPFVNLVDTAKIAAQKKDAQQITKLEKSHTTHAEFIYKDSSIDYKNDFNASWIPAFLIVLFLFLAWIRVFYNKVLRLTIRSSFNYLISNRLFREKNTLTIWGGFILNILFFLSGGFFVYLVFTYYGYYINVASGLLSYLIILFSLILIYSVKALLLKLLGLVFLQNSGFSEYIHNVFIFNKALGVFILPAIIAIPYVPEPGKVWLLDAGIIFVIILYFLRIFRGLRIGIRINVSIFYLILYLCTLEIFPLLILYKLFINYTS